MGADPERAALAGRRVLEIGGEPGMYCGKLLADMGADVVRVERPGARPLDALSYAYLNTSKRSLRLDLERESARDRFLELAARSHIVVDSEPAGALARLGLGYDTLRDRHAGLVYTSITGFGTRGPHRDFASSDLVASAMGAQMLVTGDADDPPVVMAGHQAFVMASTCAASSSLIALHHAECCGPGQHVDISLQEVMLSVTHICGIGKYLDDGIVPRRSGTGLFASVPSGTYRCKDGLVYLMVNRPLHWQALARWIHEETGNEEVIDPMFEGPSAVRIEYRDLLDIFIGDLAIQYEARDFYHEGQRRHIAVTPVNRVTDLLRDEHLRARAFFQEVPDGRGGALILPGAPYRFGSTPWCIRRPAPRPGQHGDALPDAWTQAPPAREAVAGPAAAGAGALAGIRVVEFTAGMAGPWIGRFMAWCGADVVKVESRKHPSVVRLYVPPRQPELGTQPALSPWFTDWDAGKRFVSLDLSRPEAVELAGRLVAGADVVIENYSTGVMQKLGLGWDVLREIKPDLIHFSTTGYGDSGPNARYVTWGSNIEALSGLSGLSGFEARECTITQFAYPDALSALHGLFAVMCALDHRRRSGEGQRISLSQCEATIASAGAAMMQSLQEGRDPERLGNGSREMAPHGCYRCRGEDRWCVVSVGGDGPWRALCEALDRADWAEDEQLASASGRLERAAEIDAGIEAWTRERDAYDVMTALQGRGVAAGVVQDVEDLLERDVHLRARAFFEEIPHLVKGSVRATGLPLGLTGTPGSSRRAGADIGEDNDEVFAELGLTADEIRRYREAGVIEA